jgi:hypothetical protein
MNPPDRKVTDGCKNPGTAISSISEMKTRLEKSSMKPLKLVPFQLSYTHKMRSRTEHVWPEHLKELRAENTEYKKFKQLTSELIDLSIELSKGKIAQLRNQSADS